MMIEFKEKHKILLMAFLLVGTGILTYYFLKILGTSVVFTHLFYIPIILAAFWWKRKGLVIAVFLVLMLYFSHIFIINDPASMNDYIRSLFFILIGAIVAHLSEKISKSEAFLKTILDNMNDAVSIINVHDFSIAGANSIFLKDIGKTEEEVIGQACYKMTHHRSDPCTPPDHICPLLEAVKNQKHSVAEHVHYGKNDEKKYMEISASPIKDEKGKIIQVVYISRDITERKLAEESLKQANIEFKKADKLKTQFLSVVSHELRTPLTPMRAQLQMFLGRYFGDISEKQTKSLNMIIRNTTRLDRLIGEVLDISKLESGTMKFIMEMNNLNETVENAVDTMKPKAQDKNIAFFLKQDDIPAIIFDKDRITQVIINLINNAIKYTDRGGAIEVEVLDNSHYATVNVKDNGIGIKKEDKERIFWPFEQVDSSMTRKYEGSGLGLAICNAIVSAHGGKLWVESEPGIGSTFQFRIDYKYVITNEIIEADLF